MLGNRVEQRVGQYRIDRFVEDTRPELVAEAWRVHAEGYVDMGFVLPWAVIDGALPGDIDKARGPNVDYYLATTWAPDATLNLVEQKSTMRKINIPSGEGLEALPAYRLSVDHLYPEYRDMLESLESSGIRLKEIAALSKASNTTPVAIFEVLRAAYQEALGKDEVWFFSIVSTTFSSLSDNFGTDAIRQIGRPIVFDDARIDSRVSLVPGMVVIEQFLDGIQYAYEQSVDPRESARLGRSFLFFAEGLSDDQIGPDSAALRRRIIEGMVGVG